MHRWILGYIFTLLWKVLKTGQAAPETHDEGAALGDDAVTGGHAQRQLQHVARHHGAVPAQRRTPTAAQEIGSGLFILAGASRLNDEVAAEELHDACQLVGSLNFVCGYLEQTLGGHCPQRSSD